MVTAPVETRSQLGGLTKAAVIHPHIPRRSGRGAATDGTTPARRPEARLSEAEGLAEAIFLDVAHAEICHVQDPRPGYLFGRGTLDRLGAVMAEAEIEVAVIDDTLSPIQQRNLERCWQAKVIDRTALILEIFGERARSREGQLQVELAALTFQRSRLVRSWTHLERQRGGLGFIGGPGESQLEIDRRLIDDRIAQIKRKLEEVRRTRRLHRQNRSDRRQPVVALVGYTNAGKSTLFNRLTQAGRYSDDLLFATLDTKLRELVLPSGRPALMSDTVGFISDLPHQLVAAFRATLEEVREADVVLHVADMAHPDCEAQRRDVYDVLTELGVDPNTDPRLFEAANKIDLLTGDDRDTALAATGRRSQCWPVSAATGEGIDALLAAIDAFLGRCDERAQVWIPHSDGAALAWLYSHGEVLAHRDDDTGAHLVVRLDPADRARFERRWQGRLVRA